MKLIKECKLARENYFVNSSLRNKEVGVYIGFFKSFLCVVDYSEHILDKQQLEVILLRPDYFQEIDGAIVNTTEIPYPHFLYMCDTNDSYGNIAVLTHETHFHAFKNKDFVIDKALTDELNLLKKEIDSKEAYVPYGAPLDVYSMDNGRVPPKGLYLYDDGYDTPALAYVTGDIVIDLFFCPITCRCLSWT